MFANFAKTNLCQEGVMQLTVEIVGFRQNPEEIERTT